MPFYTGVGSRSTPQDVLFLMTELAQRLAHTGYTLRSGAAAGADAAFEAGAGQNKEIYLPWRNFNGHRSMLYPPKPQAVAMVRQFHPAWQKLKPAVLLLHARNIHQVLGEDLASPSTCLICWTPGGELVGGTATAIKVALEHGIPVENLFHKRVYI